MTLSSIPSTWPPTPANLGGTILSGSPDFHVGQDGFTAMREIVVPWDKLDDALLLLFPPSTFIGGNQTVSYGAEFPGRPYLRVIDIDAKPLSPQKPLGLDFNGDYKYEHAKLVVKYGFLKNAPQSGTSPSTDPKDPVNYLTHRWTIGAEVIKTDTVGLVWDNVWNRKPLPGSGVPSPFSPLQPVLPTSPIGCKVRDLIGRTANQGDMKQGPREYVALIEHEITRERVPRPPFTALRNCVGKCNDKIVELKTGKIPKECLILWGAHLESSVMSNGEESWNMNLRFGERRVEAFDQVEVGGWNHYYREQGADLVKASLLTPQGLITNAYLGKRGFYRLEKSYGLDEKIYNSTTTPTTGFEGTDLKIGYNEETALIKQRDFSKIWLPEPIPSSP